MAAAQEQEFTVRVPPRFGLSVRSLLCCLFLLKKIVIRDERKKYHVMKFNASLNIDFSKWTQVRETACPRQDPHSTC